MTPEELAHRAHIAKRLKAARWLAGTMQPNKKGKTHLTIKALSQTELAKRDPLPANGLTATKIGASERMERYTPPMELAALIEALRLDPGWFAFTPVDSLEPFALLLREAARAGQEIRPARGGAAASGTSRGRRLRGLEGGGA